MKRESIAGSSVRVSRWRVVKQISQFANCEHRYADNTRLALPPAAVGRTAVERRPCHRTLRNAVVAGGRLKRRQDGGFPCGRDGARPSRGGGRRWDGGPTMWCGGRGGVPSPPAARRDASPHRGSGTFAASGDGLANAGSDRSVASPRGRLGGVYFAVFDEIRVFWNGGGFGIMAIINNPDQP